MIHRQLRALRDNLMETAPDDQFRMQVHNMIQFLISRYEADEGRFSDNTVAALRQAIYSLDGLAGTLISAAPRE